MALEFQGFTFNPLQENTYLLWDTYSKEAAIIDPGNNSLEENELLFQFIKKEGLEIKKILLTHGHIDHILGNSIICEKYGVEIHGNTVENENIVSADLYAHLYGLNAPNSPKIKHNLSGSEILKIGTVDAQVLFIPGHSAGHIAFYFKESNLLFSGDVIFKSSIGRTDLPGGNYATLEKSIREVIYKLPESTTIYSGHGPSTTVGFEMKFNPFFSVK